MATAQGDPDVRRTIADLVDRARAAQAQFEEFDQHRVDAVVAAVAWAIV